MRVEVDSGGQPGAYTGYFNIHFITFHTDELVWFVV